MFDEDFQPARSPYAESSIPTRMVWGSFRFILFAGVVLSFVVGLLFVYYKYQEAREGSRIIIDEGSPDLTSGERLVLQGYLVFNSSRLSEASHTGDNTLDFEVSSGQNANQIAIDLVQQGILDPTKESLFLNYLRFYGLDSQLEAGSFDLSPTLTVPELANTLTDSVGDEIELTFLEGWRAEQMAAYLAEVRPAQIDAEEFLGIVNRTVGFNTTGYAFLNTLEPDDSLEGFLFPDTYRIPLDASAAYLVNLMLGTFDQRVTPAMRQAFGAQGFNIQEAVIMASIVEREAVLADEQSIIASVFINRVNQGIKLDADPTIQYAVGYDDASAVWWKAPLTLTDLEIESPYNTYLNTGLPPGPIANPGIGALQSVATPDATDYIFFVAECEGLAPGSHLFSVTYEEHLANVENCR